MVSVEVERQRRRRREALHLAGIRFLFRILVLPALSDPRSLEYEFMLKVDEARAGKMRNAMKEVARWAGLSLFSSRFRGGRERERERKRVLTTITQIRGLGLELRRCLLGTLPPLPELRLEPSSNERSNRRLGRLLDWWGWTLVFHLGGLES